MTRRWGPRASTPATNDPSLGTPGFHPSDKGPSLGTPGLHPSDKDPSLGTPGLQQLQQWAQWHKLQALIQLRLEGTQVVLERQQQAIARHLELAGCYVITTDVAGTEMGSQQVHDSYMALQRVERDFRSIKTGALEVRPIFVEKASRTRGHVFCCMLALKLLREIEQRLRTAFGTTGDDPYAVTVADALAALSRLCLLNYPAGQSGQVVTKLPHPNDTQKKILHALKVSLPRM